MKENPKLIAKMRRYQIGLRSDAWKKTFGTPEQKEEVKLKETKDPKDSNL